MEADEERNFAALLSQSTTSPTRPTWSPQASSSGPALDPWANPFASSPSDPFVSSSNALPIFEANINGSGDGRDVLPPSAKYEEYTNGFDDVSGGFGTAQNGDGGNVGNMAEGRTGQLDPVVPEPPSVIAARERDSMGWGEEGEFGGSNSIYPGTTPSLPSFEIPKPSNQSWNENGNSPIQSINPKPLSSPPSQLQSDLPKRPNTKPTGRILPSDLIDEDLMAASDPSISLKRAFVKSTPTPAKIAAKGKTPEKSKEGAYVFRPAGKISPIKHKEVKVVKDTQGDEKEKEEVKAIAEVSPGDGKASVDKGKGKLKAENSDVAETIERKEKPDLKIEVKDEELKTQETESLAGVDDKKKTDEVSTVSPPTTEETSQGHNGEAVKAAEPSVAVEADDPSQPPSPRIEPPSPTTEKEPASIPLPASLAPTRSSSPLPPTQPAPGSPSPPIYPTQTPTHDRVAVSPLEPPTAKVGDDFGFQSLSIGGSSVIPPPSAESDGWGGSGGGNRFGGKGWGAVAVDEDEGLFGKGGPVGDPWGSPVGGGWGGEERAVAGPSSPPPQPTPFAETPSANPSTSPTHSTPSTIVSPSKPRRKTHPVFTISISDPARVGDPVRGYTVYTIRTRTTSPHYRKSEFTALRRFSDFLWLFDSLIANNPGIIVPPVPDKHTFGRFQEQFIETRRLALERSLNKIASHPVLQLDPDLRLFLESEYFSSEIKGRGRPETAEIPTSNSGLLAGWNTPKFVEGDDWFTSRVAFLDGLENQLKALSKSIEVASKSRLDMGVAFNEVGEALGNLADSDLGSAMCASLARLGDLARREKEGAEELAKGDVVNLLNMADEYVRFVGSVRRAMGGREKVWLAWQALEKEVGRLKGLREKARVQGRLGDRAAQTLAEINEVDRRARIQQQEYETLTKLVKSEFARFERERVEEFKRVLERYLDDQIAKQREMVMAWEEYHVTVLAMVKKAQGNRGEVVNE